mgnify:CR=1 FL=1
MSVSIAIDHVCKKFGENTIIPDLSANIKNGELFTLLGPSGCGKTTLLRMIAGFNTIEAGTIAFGDQVINDVPAYKRNIGMVFQSYAIFPHLTVRKNVEYGLRLRNIPKDEMKKRTDEMLRLVHIDEYQDRLPERLSGGQQQRVALARALVIEPSVLLFDEPLSNLDAKLRVSMRTEIRRIQQEVGITAIYVTHDQSEAMALSDNIIIMNHGVVEQMGTPQEIYYHPKNEFVADFIGEANFLKGTMVGVDGDHAVLDVEGYRTRVAGRDDLESGKEYTVVLRPESGTLADEGGLPCRVVLSCFMGSYQNYHVMVGNTLVKLAEHDPKNKHIYQVGDQCRLRFDPDEVHVL